MKRSGFSEEQIIGVLNEQDAGAPDAEHKVSADRGRGADSILERVIGIAVHLGKWGVYSQHIRQADIRKLIGGMWPPLLASARK